MMASAAMPAPRLDGSGTMVDAGDKWVTVLQRLQDPELCVFANLLGDAECGELIDAARPRLLRSRTIDTQTGREALNRTVPATACSFRGPKTRSCSASRPEPRACCAGRRATSRGLQVLRYRQGGEYRPHYDYFDPQEPGTASLLLRGGQRVATLIMYLHQPAAGGATVFPQADVSVVPRRGSAVFFSYANPNPASLTLHGGEPVTDGEKWIATLWLRERPFS